MRLFFGVSSVVAVLVFAALCASCGKDGETVSSSLSYEFESNGCNTGKHTFSSESELCTALQNDRLNRGCAAGLRAQHFRERKCPGA